LNTLRTLGLIGAIGAGVAFAGVAFGSLPAPAHAQGDEPPRSAAEQARLAKLRQNMTKWPRISEFNAKGRRPVSILISENDCRLLKLDIISNWGCGSHMLCVNHATQSAVCID
jgi:hypothetical protein